VTFSKIKINVSCDLYYSNNQKDIIHDNQLQKILRFIHQSKENFIDKEIYLKIFRHFWQAMTAHQKEQSYAQLLF
jgi:hypothetical protein